MKSSSAVKGNGWILFNLLARWKIQISAVNWFCIGHLRATMYLMLSTRLGHLDTGRLAVFHLLPGHRNNQAKLLFNHTLLLFYERKWHIRHTFKKIVIAGMHLNTGPLNQDDLGLNKISSRWCTEIDRTVTRKPVQIVNMDTKCCSCYYLHVERLTTHQINNVPVSLDK